MKSGVLKTWLGGKVGAGVGVRVRVWDRAWLLGVGYKLDPLCSWANADLHPLGADGQVCAADGRLGEVALGHLVRIRVLVLVLVRVRVG